MTTIESLEIKQFDIKTFIDLREPISNNKSFIGVVIGRRDYGKTHLVKDILHTHNNVYKDKTIFMFNSCYLEEYSNKFTDATVCEYEPSTVHSIMAKTFKRQRIEFEKCKINVDTDTPHSIIVFEDCIYDPNWYKDKYIKFLFMNGKFFKFSTLITLQYPISIPCHIQYDFDYIFVFRAPYSSYRKMIWENYLSTIPFSFEDFNTLMDKLLEYECYVFHITSKSSNLQDIIFLHKSSDLLNNLEDELCDSEAKL